MSRRKIQRDTPEVGQFINLSTGEPDRQVSLPIICERIRYYRKKAGLEQKELGEKVGALGNNVNNWERGRSRRPS